MSGTDCPDQVPRPPLPGRPGHASQSQGEPAAVLRLPLEIFPAGSDPLSPRAEAWWLWTFIAVGLAVRLVRYLLRFPLWEDEAQLSVNYLDRGYLGLLQPLDHLQVCPPLFLWCQLTVLKVLGFTEYTLRLIPFLCAMISVPVFRHVAGRLLRGTALVLVVGVFAVGYPMVRYAGEAKPYSSDLLVGLVMLGLAIEWLRAPGQRRWLWALAGLVGPAVGFSYPAVFVAGATSLVVAWVLWTSRPRLAAVDRLQPGAVAQLCDASVAESHGGGRGQPAGHGRLLELHIPAGDAPVADDRLVLLDACGRDVGLSVRGTARGQHALVWPAVWPAWRLWPAAARDCWCCCS